MATEAVRPARRFLHVCYGCTDTAPVTQLFVDGLALLEGDVAGLCRTAVGVDDTRAALAAMTAAGWVFDRAPMSVELTGTPVPDMWICFLRDPDGVPFELVERPRSAFKEEQR